LILFPLFQISAFAIRLQRSASNSPASTAALQSSTSATPDVYYILLDGYSRADVMRSLYDLDITPFMEDLKSLGFVFPDCAQSNYGITAFSMYATLNMQYLDAQPGTFPLGSDRREVDYQAMREYLINSQVRQFFQAHGYQMITFETGFWWLNIDNADQYIVENNNPLKKYSKEYALSNFEDLFIRTTALRILTEANTAFFSSLTRQVKTPTQQHYEWVQFSLEQLGQIPAIPGKKFVYFHVLAPHDPFVFAPDGSYHFYSNDTSDVPGYPNEVTYLNKRIAEIVRGLITSSPTPPIIIIQGDHGWDPRYRMQILNAYYLPNGGAQRLYPTITPVNTFRLILDHYFGAKYDLLPDASYFSMGSDFPVYGIRSTPYQLTPVPGSCMDSP
ncbi:MAG: sulfatase-like hydrolase/transferase, partial [Anaerolineaceae bacterium]|nr:sulfatase-like hydrolase/transferase [Anaerolineaceae bacterium]